MRKSSHTVMFKPSCDCNLNCKYCYDRPMRERFKGQKASREILEHTAKLMSEYAENVQWYWHGGEPTLLGKDYFYDAQEVFADNYNSNFKQALQTNGIIAMKDREWIDVAKDCGIGVGFSFDLYGQSERLGKDVDIIEQYENMLDDFRDKGARRNTEAVTVITNKTISRLIDTYEHFKSRFGKEYAMSLLLVFETDENNPSGLGISEEDYIKYYPEYLNHVLRDTSENAIIDRYIYTYLVRLIGDESTSSCGFIECRRKWLAVNPDGSVMHCDREPGIYYNLGNIMDYNSIDDIYNSEMYLKFEADCEERLDNYCRKCDFYYICNGGCHSNHGSVNGTRVNKVNKRECYTVQQNSISVYDMLQSITERKGYNDALLKTIRHTRLMLPVEIHSYLATKGYEYNYQINVSKYRDTPSEFTHQLPFVLFKLFNINRPTDEINLTKCLQQMFELHKDEIDSLFKE